MKAYIVIEEIKFAGKTLGPGRVLKMSDDNSIMETYPGKVKLWSNFPLKPQIIIESDTPSSSIYSIDDFAHVTEPQYLEDNYKKPELLQMALDFGLGALTGSKKVISLEIIKHIQNIN